MLTDADQVRARLLELKASQKSLAKGLRETIARPLVLDHKKAKGVNYQRRVSVRRHAKATQDNLIKNDLVFPNDVGEHLAAEQPRPTTVQKGARIRGRDAKLLD